MPAELGPTHADQFPGLGRARARSTAAFASPPREVQRRELGITEVAEVWGTSP